MIESIKTFSILFTVSLLITSKIETELHEIRPQADPGN